MQQLKIDPKFRDAVPPSKPEERERLEAEILKDGYVRDPIVIWGSRKTIVDGHTRWDIIQRHPELPYHVVEKEFENEWEAIAWMYGNQLARRNLNEKEFAYILRQEYEAQTKAVGAPIGSKNAAKNNVENSPHYFKGEKVNKTRKEIAEKHNLKEGTVKSAIEFGRGLDKAESVVPGIRDKVLSGEVDVSKYKIAGLRNMEDEDVKEAVKEIVEKPPELKPKKHPGRPKKDSEGDAILQSVISQLKDRDSVREFTIEDLEEDIGAIIQDFLGKVRRSFDIRQDTLKKDGAKERLYTMLEDAKIEITKIEEESL